jgi:hypothetical protein
MFGQTNSIYIVTVKLYKISKPGLTNVRPGFFCLLNLGMRQRWRVGLVCKTSGFHLSGFDSHQPHKKGSYTDFDGTLEDDFDVRMRLQFDSGYLL